MNSSSQPLAGFAKNVTSQNGEDGILAEIFRRIGDGTSWCLEVGAWDGKHLSNTYSFWHDHNWSAVLIECSEKSYAGLKTSTASYPKVHPVHRFAAPKGEGSLDNILRSVNAPKEVDLVSIDIDGNDYYIFESLIEYTPRVIVIEHNPTIPPELDIVQKLDSRARMGASAGAMTALAIRKGYGLAACTHCNCIFVRKSEFTRLGFAPLEVTEVFPRKQLVYLMSCLNGKTFMSQPLLYARTKRSLFAWLRNWIAPVDRSVWPPNAIPVICQKASRDED